MRATSYILHPTDEEALEEEKVCVLHTLLAIRHFVDGLVEGRVPPGLVTTSRALLTWQVRVALDHYVEERDAPPPAAMRR